MPHLMIITTYNPNSRINCNCKLKTIYSKPLQYLSSSRAIFLFHDVLLLNKKVIMSRESSSKSGLILLVNLTLLTFNL